MTQNEPMPPAPQPPPIQSALGPASEPQASPSQPPPLAPGGAAPAAMLGPAAYAPQAAAQELQTLAGSSARGGRWFYWVAGLSLVNTAMMLGKTGTYFVIGLALPIIASSLAQDAQGAGKAAALGVAAIAAGIFAALGYFATRQALWAFIVGIVLYAIDGAVFLALHDLMSAAFHALVLLGLIAGARACWRFGKLSRSLGAR
jgi:hypothetical protein